MSLRNDPRANQYCQNVNWLSHMSWFLFHHHLVCQVSEWMRESWKIIAVCRWMSPSNRYYTFPLARMASLSFHKIERSPNEIITSQLAVLALMWTAKSTGSHWTEAPYFQFFVCSLLYRNHKCAGKSIFCCWVPQRKKSVQKSSIFVSLN